MHQISAKVIDIEKYKNNYIVFLINDFVNETNYYAYIGSLNKINNETNPDTRIKMLKALDKNINSKTNINIFKTDNEIILKEYLRKELNLNLLNNTDENPYKTYYILNNLNKDLKFPIQEYEKGKFKKLVVKKGLTFTDNKQIRNAVSTIMLDKNFKKEEIPASLEVNLYNILYLSEKNKEINGLYELERKKALENNLLQYILYKEFFYETAKDKNDKQKHINEIENNLLNNIKTIQGEKKFNSNIYQKMINILDNEKTFDFRNFPHFDEKTELIKYLKERSKNLKYNYLIKDFINYLRNYSKITTGEDINFSLKNLLDNQQKQLIKLK